MNVGTVKEGSCNNASAERVLRSVGMEFGGPDGKRQLAHSINMEAYSS